MSSRGDRIHGIADVFKGVAGSTVLLMSSRCGRIHWTADTFKGWQDLRTGLLFNQFVKQ